MKKSIFVLSISFFILISCQNNTKKANEVVKVKQDSLTTVLKDTALSAVNLTSKEVKESEEKGKDD